MLTSCVNTLENPDQDEVRNHRGSSNRDERERDAGDRRHPHRHADVDKDLKEECEHEPSSDDRPIEIPGNRHYSQPAPDHEEIQEQEDDRTDEATLFSERREGECS